MSNIIKKPTYTTLPILDFNNIIKIFDLIVARNVFSIAEIEMVASLRKKVNDLSEFLYSAYTMQEPVNMQSNMTDIKNIIMAIDTAMVRNAFFHEEVEMVSALRTRFSSFYYTLLNYKSENL